MDASLAHLVEGFDLLEVGAAVFDDRKRLIFCNSAFRQMRNYPADLCHEGVTIEALLRFNAERGDFGPGDSDAQVAERIAEIENSEKRTIEREMADGQILAIRYRRTPTGGLLVTFEDRTAERVANADRDRIEARLVSSLATISDGILLIDADNRVQIWNDRYYEIFSEACGGRDLSNVIVKDRPFFEMLRDGYNLGMFNPHPDGADGWIAMRIKAWDDPVMRREMELANGMWMMVNENALPDGGRVSVYSDITVLKRREYEAAAARQQFEDAIESISTGFAMFDPEDRLQVWNSRFRDYFADVADTVVSGASFRDMLAASISRGVFPAAESNPAAFLDATLAKRAKGDGQVRENRLSNGQWLQISDHRTRDGGLASIYTDVTELKTREQEAQAARERFEVAIEAISTGFALWDAEDRMVVCNSRYRNYFPEMPDKVVPGATFTEIMSTAIKRGLFPGSALDPKDHLAKALDARARASGAPREQHLASGTWLQITDHRTNDGGLVSIYADVTELKQREEEMRDQRTILQATLENMGQGITMMDADLKILAFNKQFLDLMDFPEDLFVRGFTLESAFRFNAQRGEYGPGDVEEQVRERVELSKKFQPHRFERTRPDGSALEIVGNPLPGGGLVTTYTDITERKRAEESVKQREAELEAALKEFNVVVETINYGVLIVGPDLLCRLWNRAFLEYWDLPVELLEGRPSLREVIEFNRESGLYDVSPDEWDDWLDNRIATVSAGAIPPTEVVRADGSVMSYQCVALPDGGRMLTYFDITELKKREAEISQARDAAEAALEDLRKAQERLVQAEKMASLGQLTAGIAHEIKNPLNFVNNFARLSDELLGELAEVLEGPIAALDEEARDDAEDLLGTVRGNLVKINEHGRRADSIVKNMLLHSREGPSEKQSIALNGVAAEALNLAYHGARAENPNFNIEMKTDFSEDLGEIECFPQDLMRVFLNLITNGMYAANKRRAAEGDGFAPEISVATRMEGGKAVVEVRDNGVGIPPVARERIFLPFFTTKPAGEGTGLGLSLSFDIVVKQHGGELTVESTPNSFTAFRVALPCVLASSTERAS